MIARDIQYKILEKWNSNKVILITGARQVGKTTLLKHICEQKGDYLFINGDDPEMRSLLEDAGEQKLKSLIKNHKILFIDEAQRIKDIGIILKIIHDQISEVKLIVSGSSALDLNNELNEPLTGRKFHFNMYPLTWNELNNHFGYLKAITTLEQQLIYGSYPEIIKQPSQAEALLKEITISYLYKDLLNHKGIRKPEALDKLLLALALQLGSEVNFNEVSNTIGLDRGTIEQYINLLEKTFVIFRVQPLSRNLRNEINKTRKIYFYDNGIRNAIISNFNDLKFRNDIGALWENYLISNRIKLMSNQNQSTRFYFWRTYQQQEIDWIEERGGEFYAYEFKYNPKKVNFPKTFLDKYNPITQKVINKKNFDEFLSEKF